MRRGYVPRAILAKYRLWRHPELGRRVGQLMRGTLDLVWGHKARAEPRTFWLKCAKCGRERGWQGPLPDRCWVKACGEIQWW